MKLGRALAESFRSFRASYGNGGSAYDAANTSRLRNQNAWGRSMLGDESVALRKYDRHALMLECRDKYRNSEIAHGVCDRFADYTVWTGIKPQPQTSSKAVNDEYELYWNEVIAHTIDYRNRPETSIYDLQRQCVISRLIDGDCGFILLANGQLQPIEAELIDTPADKYNDPRVRDGVQLSEAGPVSGYWVLGRTKDGYPDPTKGTFILRENFIYVNNPFFRFDQLRGVPALAAVCNKLTDYDETDTYVLNKVKNDGMQLLKVTKEGGAGAAGELPHRSYVVEDTTAITKQKVEKHTWGQQWNLDLGEDVQDFYGRTPNPNYVGYMEHELRAIATCIGLPYEFLMLIFTSGSYSAQRAAMLHANHTFHAWNQWLIKSFLQRVYTWRIAKAIKAGTLSKAPLDSRGVSQWYWTDWSQPYFGWLDQQKENAANRDAWNNGTTSLKAIVASMGRDRDDVMTEKADDISTAHTKAQALNAANPGLAVTWRDMISTAIPGAAPANAPSPPEADDEPPAAQPPVGE